MSEQEIKDMRKLDELAEKAGGFVEPSFADKDLRYDMRRIVDYCKKRGIEPIDMTIRELNQFLIQQ